MPQHPPVIPMSSVVQALPNTESECPEARALS